MMILLKENTIAGRQWLMPVILATKEARDQEDRSSKPTQANSLQDLILKKLFIKKG
jgi:hypothetical protein